MAVQVRRVLVRVLGVDQDLPDLLHEVFARALAGIGSVEDGARLRAWLMQIAMFLALGLLVFPARLPAVAGVGLLAALFLIFVARPVSVNVDTYGTGKVEDEELQAFLESGEVFDLRPAQIIATLGLKTPKGWSYREAAAYGHFGRPQFPWEKTDRAAALRRRFGGRK